MNTQPIADLMDKSIKKLKATSYYNTTNETGADLKESEGKAQKQEVVILNFFKANPLRKYTPLMVHRLLELACPETSTRRAISNLTKDQELIRTDKKVKEKYGSPNYMWRLKPQEGQTSMF